MGNTIQHDLFRCPECGGDLQTVDDKLFCPNCNLYFSKEENVWDFYPKLNEPIELPEIETTPETSEDDSEAFHPMAKIRPYAIRLAEETIPPVLYKHGLQKSYHVLKKITSRWTPEAEEEQTPVEEPKSAANSIEDHVDEIASHVELYQSQEFFDFNKSLWYQTSKIDPFFPALDQIASDSEEPLRLLDVGSGIGLIPYLLEKRYGDKLEGFGLEITMEGCQLASKNVGFQFVRGDAEHLPFADDSFDAITAVAVLHHFYRQPKRIMEEMKRVLKPGGILYINDPHLCRDPDCAKVNNIRFHLNEILETLKLLTGYEEPVFPEARESHSEKALAMEALVQVSDETGFTIVETGYRNIVKFQAVDASVWKLPRKSKKHLKDYVPQAGVQCFLICRK